MMNYDSQLYKLIEERAYQLYLQRNGNAHDPSDDWKQAEQEIMLELRERSRRVYEDQLADSPDNYSPG